MATANGVHRIDRPLVLFTLSGGGGVHRLVALGFDGRVTLIDFATPGAPSRPRP